MFLSKARRGLLFIISLVFLNGMVTQWAFAAENNYVTPIFPVRGCEYWREGCDYQHFYDLKDVVLESELSATWLVHYDVLADDEIVSDFKSFPDNQEFGLFLEVTLKWANDAHVLFDWENDHWSASHKLFLSGYTLEDRRRLIDKAFESFREVFGYYPSSYGAWYVDVYSMTYIKDKYGAEISLGLADQYSTDGYQTWGQYIDQPYFVSKKSAIEPAKNIDDSTGVLKILWAPREPTLSFGDSVEYSNFSVQVNDYFRAKGLHHEYFEKLLKDITVNVRGRVSGIVIGLEVGEVNKIFLSELVKQLDDLKMMDGEISTVTMTEFNEAYRSLLDENPVLFLSSEPSNGYRSYWYMSPNYRLGLFVEDGEVKLKDWRLYHQNIWRDNDQAVIDHRHNLSRLVPALVDQVTYKNEVVLGIAKDFAVEKSGDVVGILFDDKAVVMNPRGPEFVGIERDLLPMPSEENGSPLDTPCFQEAGGIRPPRTCMKALLSKMSNYVPDLVYSKINTQHYFGMRVSREDMYGVRFPKIGLGRYHFYFPTLENFISLKEKLTPEYEWYGKQEFEVRNYDKDQIVDKQGDYGQDNLRKYNDKKKVFENGYYAVFVK